MITMTLQYFAAYVLRFSAINSIQFAISWY